MDKQYQAGKVSVILLKNQCRFCLPNLQNLPECYYEKGLFDSATSAFTCFPYGCTLQYIHLYIHIFW